MSERRAPARTATSTTRPKTGAAPAGSPHAYPRADWLTREDPRYPRARQPLSALSGGEGKDLSVEYREMVLTHMRRAIQHGATRRERLEAMQAAAPGGVPTLSAGVQALMDPERRGAFRKA